MSFWRGRFIYKAMDSFSFSFGRHVETHAPTIGVAWALPADVSSFDQDTPVAPIVQKTLAAAVTCVGVGVHSGAQTTLVLRPAPVNSGITFIRTDLPEAIARIPAVWNAVCDTRMCTALTNAHGTKISTVEHLMAALAGFGLTNLDILVDGPEVPIMDGSSAPFVTLINATGVHEQAEAGKAIKVLRLVEVRDGDKLARLTPATDTTFSMEIEFASRAIGHQARSFTLADGSFSDELSDARTFGFLQEVEYLRSIGLARGGSLENAVVIDGDKLMNEDGLRHPDEFVRHKLLDAVGDLSLAGAPILGAYHGVKSGHALNNQLLHALFADPANWCYA